jgi:ribosomal protein S18 acetylase RimI-like enzyme
MIIREFRKQDLDRILQFKCASVKVSFPACEFDSTNFRKNLLAAPAGSVLVAEEDGIIGYVYLKTRKTGIGKYGTVNHIFVDPEYRDKGIASALMQKAEQYFHAQGIKRMRLTITVTNKPSLGLARKLGYKEKRVIMEKELK